MKALLVSVAALAVAIDGPARSAGQPPSELGKLMARLAEEKPKFGKDEWAAVLRDMIVLGPDAVPDLVAELDKTQDPYVVKCLAFVARGIGDKRAVPAVIRAFPKALAPPGSDYGLIAKDPALLRFMQKHDHDKKDGGTHYSFGRPYTEVRATLQKLTGATNGEDEVNFSLGGSPRQQYLQRELYHRCAVRWANWWEAHWKEFVTDEAYSRVNLPALAGDEPPARADFPHGPGVKVTGGVRGAVLENARDPKARRVLLDLDTGREGRLPEQLRAADGQPDRLDEIAAWAAVEGFDLMGTELKLPGDDKPHYVIRGLGLAAWRFDGDRRKALEADLRGPNPLKGATRADGLLTRYDAETGRFDPADTATYLFRTREDGYGAIFVGVEVHDTNVRLGMPVGENPDLNPVAFRKGRRYGYSLVTETGFDPTK